jgi:hypothetical protein
MGDFESVSEEEFQAIIDAAPTTGTFRRRYAALTPRTDGEDFQVHHGDLDLDGNFVAPAYCTLIVGNLTVSGFVDLANPYDKGFDEGGLFVVLGDVECRVWAGEGGKCAFVDGDLVARDLLLNAYEDSSLIVTGALGTHFFYGIDIWAEVGTGAVMEYGHGYALLHRQGQNPLQIDPRHDAEASMALIAGEDVDELSADALMDRVRSGEAVFR